MKRASLFRLVAAIAAVHVAVLSMIFGRRHVGYILAATLSATLIWGVVFFLNERKRRAGGIAGVIVSLAVQQVAYQVWKAELPGFWWPLAEFGALQFLIGLGISRPKRPHELPTLMTHSTGTIQWKGQARVDWLSTKGPRGSETLTVGDGHLNIASRLGNFIFSPQTVERIERAGFFPWFWTGIQINHRVATYPRRIGFWPRGASSQVILQELQRRGYPVANDEKGNHHV